MNEYDSKGRVWTSFGEFDRSQFELQCGQLNIDFPFGKTHLNIKSLFPLKMKFTKAKGLSKALKILNEDFDGIHHCGADDAYNAAKILRHILT
jgi:inhibitor of KinA sporulation pathway (predicted exonuclease)